MDTLIYRGMNQRQLDAAYNNLAVLSGIDDLRNRWMEQSARVRAGRGAILDVPYDVKTRTRLDYFPSGEMSPPLFVFIHGGYWQRNAKEDFAFVAEGPRCHGIDVALIGYTLAPLASLSEIVEEVRRALTFLAEHATDFAFDPTRIFVGGWSAGGHLTAAVSDHPVFRGGLGISGIYDLEPISLCYLNKKLRLTPFEVDSLSPLRSFRSQAPMRLAAGANELPEMSRQSQSFANEVAKRGGISPLKILANHNHFSILDELSPEGELTRELKELVA